MTLSDDKLALISNDNKRRRDGKTGYFEFEFWIFLKTLFSQALHWAARNGHLNCVELLTTYKDKNDNILFPIDEPTGGCSFF